ncbi:MAG: low molecular weight phosphotyrosine protein phosphatase [Erysipelotrichaceae bacterium]|nr:low molecular weight phosphotyrosine protein phosphatase [Erysipelotrichaceae bacterium]
MIRVLFVCHGNICRSPMAEFLFKDYVKRKNKSELFEIASCATSNEEIGNPVHYGTKRILNDLGIDCSSKRARRMTMADYDYYDYIIVMDENNIRNITYIIGNDKYNKLHLLLEYAGLNRGIRDPWYTGNFTETYKDIILGIEGFYKYLEENNKC